MFKLKIGGAAGFAVPIVAFTCILSAVASYPQFSWTNNALSDLGVAPGVTAPIFNFGLVTAGVLALGFATLGLFTYMGQCLAGKVGSIIFAASTVAIICIGIFNENFSPTHYLVSVAFFALTPISLFVLTYAFWLNRQRGLAGFTVAVGVVAAAPWILEFTMHYAPNVAIPETISAVVVSMWAIVLSVKMLRSMPRSISLSSIS